MQSERETTRASVSRVVDLDKDLTKSLDSIGWTNQVKTDSTVFVKPNFTYPYYRQGITTNPNLLKPLLELLKNRGRRVIIGESDGGYRAFSADQAFKGHSIPEICKDTGAELVNLSKMERSVITGAVQGRETNTQVPTMLLEEIDCFVDVPVLKVHAMTGVTLSIKNLWGCNPDTMRCLDHKHLDYRLALLTKTLNPNLVIVDGTYALDNHGPMYGEAKKTDLVLTSDNAVLADSLGAAIMGIPLRKASHILLAHREGLGPIDLLDSGVLDDWRDLKMTFSVKKTALDRLSTLLFRNDVLARVVMDSRLTPYIHRIAGHLRTSRENEVYRDLGRFRT